MKDFATELATTQKGYVPWVTPAEVSSVEEIPAPITGLARKD
ncbi:MAG TPA: hypothetical protein VFK70_13510 [Vicinamibacteria bacterium]|nr:hypothetical protein [Vicinamibacteria bacterium]